MTFFSNSCLIIGGYMSVLFTAKTLLPLVAPYLSDNPVIVEAGAFNGSDTLRLARQWPAGVVHCFEPVPELYEELVLNTSIMSNIRCHPIALSTHMGSAILHVAQKPSKPGRATQAGSLHAPKERLAHSPIIFPSTITVPTTTLDAWAHDNNVSVVDLLWLDLQGHELAVMQSAPILLPSVKVIYTEVGFIEAYEGQPRYQQVKEWLEAHNFTEVGRDFGDNPTWFFGNALFVNNTCLAQRD